MHTHTNMHKGREVDSVYQIFTKIGDDILIIHLHVHIRSQKSYTCRDIDIYTLDADVHQTFFSRIPDFAIEVSTQVIDNILSRKKVSNEITGGVGVVEQW